MCQLLVFVHQGVSALDAFSLSTLLDAHPTERKFVLVSLQARCLHPAAGFFLGLGHSLDMKLGQQTR